MSPGASSQFCVPASDNSFDPFEERTVNFTVAGNPPTPIAESIRAVHSAACDLATHLPLGSEGIGVQGAEAGKNGEPDSHNYAVLLT